MSHSFTRRPTSQLASELISEFFEVPEAIVERLRRDRYADRLHAEILGTLPGVASKVIREGQNRLREATVELMDAVQAWDDTAQVNPQETSPEAQYYQLLRKTLMNVAASGMGITGVQLSPFSEVTAPKK